MADPVFALSPISARGAAPTEADYDAIREAFMETARGRWFLTEYAKRNRNADTNLVLDAVSRLESTLAAQKQDQRDRTAEVIAAIHALVIEARSEAAVLISVRDTPDEDSPALKGVRVLREMAWTLRESGSDGRIPDLLKRQADAIEEGLKAAIDETARDHLLSVFDRLAGEIEAVSGNGAAAAPTQQQPPATAAAPQPVQTATVEDGVSKTAAFDAPQDGERAETQALADELQAVADAMTTDDVADVAVEPEAPAEPAQAVQASSAASSAAMQPAGYVTMDGGSADDTDLVWDEPEAAAIADEVIAETAATTVETTAATAGDLAAATDEPAPAEAETQAAIEALTRFGARVASATAQSGPAPQPVPVDAISTDRMVALEAAIMAPAAEPTPVTPPDAAAATLNAAPRPMPESSMSLGAALLEKGIVAKPGAPRADPLAPFKRMTQAERVAFFS